MVSGSWDYILGIVTLLALPCVVPRWVATPGLDRAALWLSTLTIAAIGSTWSATLCAQGWWQFGARHCLGIWLAQGHLLLEELLFYPIAGALVVLLYQSGRNGTPLRGWARPALAALTVGFLAVAALRTPHSQYLTSQIVVYNLISLGFLAKFPSAVDAGGARRAVLGLAVIGGAWDSFAYPQGWWTYRASTGMLLGGIPFDDLNFFVFAPLAGICAYEGWRLALARRSALGRGDVARTLHGNA